MSDYRLVFLAPAGHVAGVKELSSPNDEAAIQAALELADGRVMELWEHHRRVKQFDPKETG